MKEAARYSDDFLAFFKDHFGFRNTLISNWCVKDVKDAAEWNRTAQIFEVTPDKKIVWALSQWADPDLGPGSMIQLLDQPGGYGVGA